MWHTWGNLSHPTPPQQKWMNSGGFVDDQEGLKMLKCLVFSRFFLTDWTSIGLSNSKKLVPPVLFLCYLNAIFVNMFFSPPTSTQNQNSKPVPFLSSWTWTAWGFYFAFMQHLFSYGFALSVLLAPLLAVYSVEWAEHLVQALAQECAWEKRCNFKYFLIFTLPPLAKWSKFDEHFFQHGLVKNHQLDKNHRKEYRKLGSNNQIGIYNPGTPNN